MSSAFTCSFRFDFDKQSNYLTITLDSENEDVEPKRVIELDNVSDFVACLDKVKSEFSLMLPTGTYIVDYEPIARELSELLKKEIE